jgi:hypothetical protein
MPYFRAGKPLVAHILRVFLGRPQDSDPLILKQRIHITPRRQFRLDLRVHRRQLALLRVTLVPPTSVCRRTSPPCTPGAGNGEEKKSVGCRFSPSTSSLSQAAPVVDMARITPANHTEHSPLQSLDMVASMPTISLLEMILKQSTPRTQPHDTPYESRRYGPHKKAEHNRTVEVPSRICKATDEDRLIG